MQAKPMNSPPTGLSLALKNTTMPSTEMTRKAMAMPALTRASARRNRFQPMANQWTP